MALKRHKNSDCATSFSHILSLLEVLQAVQFGGTENKPHQGSSSAKVNLTMRAVNKTATTPGHRLQEADQD